jgi:hypothetical protein
MKSNEFKLSHALFCQGVLLAVDSSQVNVACFEHSTSLSKCFGVGFVTISYPKAQSCMPKAFCVQLVTSNTVWHFQPPPWIPGVLKS